MTEIDDVTIDEWCRHAALTTQVIEDVMREQPPAGDELATRRFVRDRIALLRRYADHLALCQSAIASAIEALATKGPRDV